MASSMSTKDASRTLTENSAAAKAKRIKKFSEGVKICLRIVKDKIKHIPDCKCFPCPLCLMDMQAIKRVSELNDDDRNAVADGLGIATDYCKMFAYTWKRRDMLRKIEDIDREEDVSENTGKIMVFYFELLVTSLNFSDRSDYFCLQMEEDGCLSLIVNWFLHLLESKTAMKKWVDEFVLQAMNILKNACRRVPYLAPNHHRALPALQKFRESEESMTRVVAFMTLAKLVKKEETDKLSTNYTCILTLLSLLKKCLSNPEHIAETERQTGTVVGLHAEELLQSVGDLAINDNNKRLIVEHGGIPIHAKLLQRDCSVVEKTSAANVMWRLAILKENKEKLRKEHDIIYNLSEGSRDINKKLRDACEGALFEINKTTDVESPQGAPSLENEHSGHHAQQQKITKASLGSKAYASPRPSASTPVDIPPQGASKAVVEVCTSKARKVSDEMLNNLAKCVPAYAYGKLSEKLGVKHNQARNIVTKYRSDYEEATRECLAKWMDRSTRSVADLHDVLRAAELGGLIGNCY